MTRPLPRFDPAADLVTFRCKNCGNPTLENPPTHCHMCGQPVSEKDCIIERTPRPRLTLWADTQNQNFYESGPYRTNARNDGQRWNESDLPGLARTHTLDIHAWVESGSELLSRATLITQRPLLILFSHPEGAAENRDGTGQTFTSSQLEGLRSHVRLILL